MFVKEEGLAIIFAAYDVEHSLLALGLIRLFSEISSPSILVIVANSTSVHESLCKHGSDRCAVLLGSNLDHEFSAWQEGLDFLGASIMNYENIIFINDTVGRSGCHLGSNELILLMQFVHANRRNPSAYGHIYDFHRSLSCEINGMNFGSWLSTGLFMLNRSALSLLNYRVNYCSELLPYISAEQDNDTLFSPLLDRALAQHIEEWLVGGRWHLAKCKPFSSYDLAMLRKKSLMILCEKYLSALLSHGKTEFINLRHYSTAKVTKRFQASSLAGISAALRQGLVNKFLSFVR